MFKQELWCACGAHTVIEARDSLDGYPSRSEWQAAHKDHHAALTRAADAERAVDISTEAVRIAVARAEQAEARVQELEGQANG